MFQINFDKRLEIHPLKFSCSSRDDQSLRLARSLLAGHTFHMLSSNILNYSKLRDQSHLEDLVGGSGVLGKQQTFTLWACSGYIHARYVD